MDRLQALHSWTLAGAYASFDEDRKGSLAPGKLADFVLLDHDIMTVEPRQILQTKVLRTYLGGKLVYEAR